MIEFIVATALFTLALMLLSPQTAPGLWQIAGTLLASLAGAGFGAHLAFKNEQTHRAAERDQERDEAAHEKKTRQIAALKQIQFVLLSHLNHIESISREHLDDYRQDSKRAFHVIPFDDDFALPTIEFTDVGELLELNGNVPDVLGDAFRALGKSTSFRGDVRSRNEIHFEFQRLTDEPGRKITVPFRVAIQMVTLTDSMYQNADSTLVDITAALNRIERLFRDRFPGVARLGGNIIDPVAEREPLSAPLNLVPGEPVDFLFPSPGAHSD